MKKRGKYINNSKNGLEMIEINEIFYSIQGEGSWVGQPCVFVRLAGCNLKCEWCDTNHEIKDVMSNHEVFQQVLSYPCRYVVFTGGEPLLQLDELTILIHELRRSGRLVAVETNGTVKCDSSLFDLMTISPKGLTRQFECHDLKIIYEGQHIRDILEVSTRFTVKNQKYIQPLWGDDAAMQGALIIVQNYPSFRLSWQSHKYLGVK